MVYNPADHPTGGAVPDAQAQADLLAPLVYQELRRLARRDLRRIRGDHTLQPTALVHEAFIRLREAKKIDWQGKTHFLALAATQMRRILVEHLRKKLALKRGGGLQRVTLDEDLAVTEDRTVEMLALEEALEELEKLSSRRARVVELRLFTGLSVEETAGVVGMSPRTVKADWQFARAWLARSLKSPSERSS